MMMNYQKILESDRPCLSSEELEKYKFDFRGKLWAFQHSSVRYALNQHINQLNNDNNIDSNLENYSVYSDKYKQSKQVTSKLKEELAQEDTYTRSQIHSVAVNVGSYTQLLEDIKAKKQEIVDLERSHQSTLFELQEQYNSLSSKDKNYYTFLEVSKLIHYIRKIQITQINEQNGIIVVNLELLNRYRTKVILKFDNQYELIYVNLPEENNSFSKESSNEIIDYSIQKGGIQFLLTHLWNLYQ